MIPPSHRPRTPDPGLRTILRLFPGAALLAISAALPAAELVIRDLGLAVESPASGFDYTVSDPVGSRSGSDAFDNPMGITLGGRWSFAGTGASHGLVLGSAVYHDQAGYGGGSWSANGVRGSAGWAYAASDRLALLGEVVVGVGREDLEVEGDGRFAAASFSGLAIEPGLHLGALFALTDSLVVTGDVGWTRSSLSLSDGSTDLDLTRSGISAALGLAWRFANHPSLLE